LTILCRGLDLKKLNVVGFSLGGMISPQLAFEHPGMIRRMILFGTGPRGGEGMTFTELSLDEWADPVALLMISFLLRARPTRPWGGSNVERLKRRVTDRDAPVSMLSAGAQLEAIREWGAVPSSDRYVMLSKISHRTLIAHGNKDIVVIPINAFLLEQHRGMPSSSYIRMPTTGQPHSTRKFFLSMPGYF
jgi:pimeloyl-ACP methyl ester carboxylesterase